MKLYGVIGNPIGHSLSPLIHNDAFSSLQIDAHYHAFRIEEDKLADAVKGFRATEIAGFNVTIPHKVAIMQYLDSVDDLAKQIGAVNTVVNKDGQLIGYNTDGTGYVRALESIAGDSLSQKRVLLIGAGGACRAIYFTLASKGITQIDIANRTISRAQDLIDSCHYQTSSYAVSLEEALQNEQSYDIIVNTTSVGMYPHVEDSPFSIQELKQGAIVTDIIYNPFQTTFLTEAKRAGAIVQNGVDMFVYQGALAFQLWTGKWPNVERMKQLVITKLGG
ncbi:shikimate dehydrogenase [Ectobacillus polymachus]|uniref:shikimate dehydrogenase n=1 Tax=Ectobacillus polymachus TaxID=1508806 RepID=UPI003A8A86C4